MKKTGKRLITLMLALAMLLAMGVTTTGAESKDLDVEYKASIFPLEEPMTFDIMVQNDLDVMAYADKNPALKKLEELTNIKINWIALPVSSAMNSLNSLLASHQEGDAIMGMAVTIGESGVASLGATGMIIPLDEYVDNPEIMPNLNKRVFAESPESRGLMTTADGHVYSLIKYTALDGNSLETPLWINKVWLDAVGEEMPATLDDLHRVLEKFRDNDVNGNGDPSDEIPLMTSVNGTFNYPEGLLQMWGLATKDLPNDRYMDVKDGKVYYVGAADAYHEALRTLGEWYKEGLIYSEVFTANADTFSAIMQNEAAPLVGVMPFKEAPTGLPLFGDQYVQLPPISADGYQAKWWKHPGRLGGKGMFSITRSCENPEILASWVDLFYDFEISMTTSYGTKGEGWDYNEDGMAEVAMLDLNKDEDVAIDETKMGNVADNFPAAYTAADYASRMLLTPAQEMWQKNVEVYRDVWATECWPRPYIADDVFTRINELYTDIDSYTDMQRANWMTGKGDIDAEWDGYINQLNSMGLEEFVELHQQAYDIYLEGMNSQAD